VSVFVMLVGFEPSAFMTKMSACVLMATPSA